VKTRGPKTKFNEKIGEAFVRLTEEGKTLEEAADLLGFSKKTLCTWMGKHVDLGVAVREARKPADELVEAALFRRATGYSHPEEKVAISKLGDVIPYVVEKRYPPDTQAAVFWLRNRQPKRWKEKTEGDVTVNNNLTVENLTDEQLNSKINAMLEKAKGPKE
jgi:hypothetical protein